MDKIAAFKHLRNSAERVKKFANSLVAELTETMTDAILALENGKANKPSAVSVSIPITGWGSDNTADYPKYYDLVVSGVSAKDKALVLIAPASMSLAAACGFCPTCETMSGKIRLRAGSVPTAALTAQYWLEKGKE